MFNVKLVGRYFSVVLILLMAVGVGFGVGFEYGTGVPITSLLVPDESVALPSDITVKTTKEAKAVIEEALQDKEYGEGYNCLDYAWTAMRALNWDGQPAAIATIMYDDGTGHAVVLTATEDNNWMFIDPATGMTLKPTIEGVLMGHTIIGINVLTIRWVSIEDFKLNPVFEYEASK